MTSFDDRLAVAQEGIDNLDADGSVNFSSFTSHAHRSMVKEGYWRFRHSRNKEADITWNGWKWTQKMLALGYLTGTPIAPARAMTTSMRPPKHPSPDAHVVQTSVPTAKVNPLQQG